MGLQKRQGAFPVNLDGKSRESVEISKKPFFFRILGCSSEVCGLEGLFMGTNRKIHVFYAEKTGSQNELAAHHPYNLWRWEKKKSVKVPLLQAQFT